MKKGMSILFVSIELKSRLVLHKECGYEFQWQLGKVEKIGDSTWLYIQCLARVVQEGRQLDDLTKVFPGSEKANRKKEKLCTWNVDIRSIPARPA